jgi:hypothetical protein
MPVEVPRYGKVDQGLRSVAAEGQRFRAEDLEPRLEDRDLVEVDVALEAPVHTPES